MLWHTNKGGMRVLSLRRSVRSPAEVSPLWRVSPRTQHQQCLRRLRDSGWANRRERCYHDCARRWFTKYFDAVCAAALRRVPVHWLPVVYHKDYFDLTIRILKNQRYFRSDQKATYEKLMFLPSNRHGVQKCHELTWWLWPFPYCARAICRRHFLSIQAATQWATVSGSIAANLSRDWRLPSNRDLWAGFVRPLFHPFAPFGGRPLPALLPRFCHWYQA